MNNTNTKAVDERVVEMRFDNAQFEKGVKQTTDTLDRFKRSLNSTDMSKSFDAIEQASHKVKLSGLTEAVQESEKHFSALQVIGISALATIASKATQVGMQLIKALSLNPILDGFREYETEMNSIKTIHANLPDTSFQKIKDTLKELNDYADLTIYSFGDMTRAIGYFTAAGVEVDAAARAIKGLSNIAAGAGANNQALARAEYQVSQALQGGVIHLMDWNSLMQAGMASPEFQRRIIDNARAMGKPVDQLIQQYGSFRESLREDWLTTDVFLKTMDQAADATTDWGGRLTQAATVVNTFSQLTGTVAEAIGTGWGETMKLILGDAEQSTELFTGIYRAIDPLISAYTKFRNDQVRVWAEMGGREAIIQGISHAFEALKNLLAPVGDILVRVFGKSGEVVAKLSQKFSEFAAKLEEKTRPIKEFFKPLTDGADKAQNAINGVKDSVEEITELANAAINGDWGNGQERIDRLREAGHSFELVQNKVNELLGCEYRYATEQDNVNELVAEGSENLGEMSDELDENARKQRASAIAFANYNNSLTGFHSALNIVRKGLDVVFYTGQRVFEVLSRLAISFGKVALAITGGVGRIFTAIDGVLERLGVVDKAKEKIGGAFDKLSDPLDKFDRFADKAVDKIGLAVDFIVARIENIEDTMDHLKSKYGPTAIKVYGQVVEFISDRVKDLTKFISQLRPKAEPLLDNAQTGLGKIVSLLRDMVGSFDFSRVISFITNLTEALVKLITLGIDQLKNKMSGLPSPLQAFGRGLEVLRNQAGGLATKLMELFQSIKMAETLQEAGRHISNFVGQLRPLEGLKDIFKKILPEKAYGKLFGESLDMSSLGGIGDSITNGLQSNEKPKSAFKTFVDNIGIKNLVQDIRTAFNKASLSGIADSVANFCSRIGKTFSAGIKIGSIDISRPFHTIRQVVGEGISSIGSRIGAAFDKVDINGLTKGASAMGQKVGQVVGQIPKLITAPLENLKKAFNIIGSAIKSFFDGFSQGMISVGSGLSGGMKAIWDLIYQILDLLRMLISNPTTGLTAMLFMVYKNVSTMTAFGRLTIIEVAKLNASINELAKSIGNIGKGVKWAGVGVFLLGFTKSIKLLTDSINILKDISPENIAKGIVTIAVLGALLAAAAFFIGKFTDLRNVIADVKKGDDPLTQFINVLLSLRAALSNVAKAAMYAGMGVMIIGLAAGISVLIQAILKLKDISIDDLISGLPKLIILLVILVGSMTLLALQGQNLQRTAMAMLLVSVSVILLAAAVKSWAKILSDGGMEAGILAVTLLVAGLVTLMIALAAVGGLTKGTGGGVLQAAASILIVVIALQIILGAVSKLSAMLKEDSEQTMAAIRQIGDILAALTICVAVLTFVSKVVGGGSGSALAAAIGLAAVMFAMGQLLQQISTLPDPNAAAAVVEPLIWLSGVIGVLIIALNKLTEDPTDALSAAIPIAGIIGMLTLFMYMLSLLDGKNLEGYADIIRHMIGILVVVAIVIIILIGVMDICPISMAAVALLIGLFLAVALMFGAIAWAAQAMGDSIGKIAAGLDSLADTLAKMQQLDDSAPGKLLGILTHLAGGILEVGLANLFDGAGALEKLAPPIGYLSFSLDKWASVDPSVGPKIRDVLAGIGDGIGHLNLGGWGADALAKCANAIGYLGEHVRAWEWVNPDLGKNIRWTLENASGGIRSLNDTLGGAQSIQAAAGAISYLGEHIRAWESVNPDLGKSISETLKNLAGSLNSFNGSAEASNQIGFAAYNIDKLSASIEKYSATAPKLTEAKVSQDDFSSSLQNLSANSALSEEDLKKLSETTGVSMDEIMAKMKEGGQVAGVEFPQNLDGGLQEGQEIVEGHLPNYEEKFQKYVDATHGAGENMANAATEAGNKTGDGLVQGITEEYTEASKAGEDLGESAINGIKDATSDSHQVGKDLDQGFISGILNGTSGVLSAVMSLGGNALDALRKVLGIASPSKETGWMGEMITAGFEQGMIQSETGLLDTVSNIGSDMLSEFSKIDSNTKFAPAITPIVDWSNFQNGSEQLQSTINGISGRTNIDQSVEYRSDAALLNAILEMKKDLKTYNDNLANLRPNVVIDGGIRSGVTEQMVDQRITDWANDVIQTGRGY